MHSVADEGYQDFVASINDPLTFLHLKLKRTKYNVSKELSKACACASHKLTSVYSLLTFVLQLDDEWYIAFVNEVRHISDFADLQMPALSLVTYMCQTSSRKELLRHSYYCTAVATTARDASLQGEALLSAHTFRRV